MKRYTTLIILMLSECFHLGLQAQYETTFDAYYHWGVADSLNGMRNFQEALDINLMVIDSLTSQENLDPSQYTNGLRRIGVSNRLLGNTEECLEFLEASVNFGKANLPENHFSTSSALNSLGIFHLIQGNYDVSESVLLEAQSIREALKSEAVHEVYNNLGLLYQYNDQYDLSLEVYFKSLNAKREHFPPKHVTFQDVFQNIGTVYHIMGDLDKALVYYDSSVWVMEDTLPPNHANYGGIYNNKALAYLSKGDYKKAIDNYRKSIENYHQNPTGDQENLSKIYSNFGLYLYQYGDYNRALVYFQKALDIRTNLLGEDHFMVARSLNYIGNCYLGKKDLDQAESWLLKAHEIREKNKKENPTDLADSFQDIGKLNMEFGYWTIALEYFTKALEINQRILGSQHENVADNYDRIGHVFLVQKKPERAAYYFNKALKIYKNAFGEVHPKVAKLYNNLGKCYPDDFQKSKTYCDKALIAIGCKNGCALANVSKPTTLLEIYQSKAELIYQKAQSTKDIEDLLLSKAINKKAFTLIDSIKISYQEPGSKQSLLDNFFKVYENAIEVNYSLFEQSNDLNYLYDAFEIAERSNSTLLIEALNTLDADSFSGIPKDLLEKERQLKIDIGFNEKLKFEEEQKGQQASEEKIKEYAGKIFELKQQQEEVIKIFLDSYPQFYDLKYADKTCKVKDLQTENLLPNQVLVEYFVGEDHLYIFAIAKDDFIVKKIDKSFPLEAWIQEFRTSIYYYHPARSDVEYLLQKYGQIGYELYQNLIEPVDSFINGKDLIIIPGGVLGYLPFEALLNQEYASDWQVYDYPFLLKDHVISYNYSASLWKELGNQKPLYDDGDFLGFAPSFSGLDSVITREGKLGKLRFNKLEVQNIQDLLGGKIFIDSNATILNFLDYASQFNILHLATHGIANDQAGDYSYLAFYQPTGAEENNLLYVKDLYNLKLQANLVVLSACETAIGEFQRGEGIVSLARGFFYAGANSIVTTLWKLDDKASLELMNLFYKNLKEGLPKDKALQKAKISFIENQKDFQAHPLYWAAFVPVGDMNTMALSTPFNWLYLLIPITLLLLVYLFRKSKKSSIN